MKALVLLVSAMFALAACNPSKDAIKKTIEENPEIVLEMFKKHPLKTMKALGEVQKLAQQELRDEQEKEEQNRLENEFNNPKKPNIDGIPFVGSADAPIVIVEYSDFECPYCTRGYNVVKKVKEEYGDKVKFIYKHLPLDFHPKAMPAAQYFEAIALQSPEKAYKFHDQIFENQDKLKSGGEKWMEGVAKKLGVDVKKMLKDANSSKVKDRIAADISEANGFDITGTPGFIINGVTLKGAYPFDEFKKIIERHLEKKK